MSNFLRTNEGTADRIARVVIGSVVLSQAFVGLHTPWAYVGIVPLLTGVWGTCPLYSVLGFTTCPVRASRPA